MAEVHKEIYETVQIVHTRKNYYMLFIILICSWYFLYTFILIYACYLIYLYSIY